VAGERGGGDAAGCEEVGEFCGGADHCELLVSKTDMV
jgi:hypothetical protein